MSLKYWTFQSISARAVFAHHPVGSRRLIVFPIFGAGWEGSPDTRGIFGFSFGQAAGIRTGAVKSRKERSRVGYEPHAPLFMASAASGFTLNASQSSSIQVHRVTREPWLLPTSDFTDLGESAN